MDLTGFLANYGLIILLVVLLIFMFWSSRRRMAKQKTEQEAKARQTVPGAQVLLQGGLYGTIVEYDADDLDKPAIVEIAPGVDIKVHSQAILRIVTPGDDVVTEHEYLEAEDEDVAVVAPDDISSLTDEPAKDAKPVADPDSDADAKPNA